MNLRPPGNRSIMVIVLKAPRLPRLSQEVQFRRGIVWGRMHVNANAVTYRASVSEVRVHVLFERQLPLNRRSPAKCDNLPASRRSSAPQPQARIPVIPAPRWPFRIQNPTRWWFTHSRIRPQLGPGILRRWKYELSLVLPSPCTWLPRFQQAQSWPLTRIQLQKG